MRTTRPRARRSSTSRLSGATPRWCSRSRSRSTASTRSSRPGRSSSPTCISRRRRSSPGAWPSRGRPASRTRRSRRPTGGRGRLMGGVPGVLPAKVLVLGGGIVGYNAALIAQGMQADVTVFERSVDRMRELDVSLGRTVLLQMSSRHAIEEALPAADLVIGGVLVHGAKAPHLITRDMLASMKPGSVLVDVAIDQGGCFETSRPTTHSDPTYVVEDIVHYCVANMPGAVPIT